MLHRQAIVLGVSLLCALLLLLSGASGESDARQEKAIDKGPAGAPYAAGELLVALKADAQSKKVEALLRQVGGKEEKSLPDVNAVLISLPEVKNVRAQQAREAALERIRQKLGANPNVEAADYNYLRQPNYVPNDRLFGQQWGMKRPRFPAAWNTADGRGVRVGVVDSGIDAGHPDIRGKVFAQRDFVNGDGRAEDRVGHGTHVSGIIAARTNNRRGVAGGCPRCTLVVAKVFDQNGAYDSDVARGINWSVNRRVEVVNLSLGGTGSSAVLKRAVDRAWSKGAVVVAAAGNESTSRPSYPAAYGRAIAVSATTGSDRRARFSNYGNWVDVAAPGVKIASTVPGGYANYSGTSMAAPHVSALAGLLAGQGFSKQKIRGRIQGTAVDLGPRGRDPYYGHGRINAFRAVR